MTNLIFTGTKQYNELPDWHIFANNKQYSLNRGAGARTDEQAIEMFFNMNPALGAHKAGCVALRAFIPTNVGIVDSARLQRVLDRSRPMVQAAINERTEREKAQALQDRKSTEDAVETTFSRSTLGSPVDLSADDVGDSEKISAFSDLTEDPALDWWEILDWRG